MRTIKYIVLHCTATSQTATVNSILLYWEKTLKWRNPGYHYLIDRFGNVNVLQPLEKPANGVRGYNQSSVHVSYIGGINQIGRAIDNRTDEQKDAMKRIVSMLKDRFPKAEVLGHRDFPNVAKDCPCFDAKEWAKTI